MSSAEQVQSALAEVSNPVDAIGAARYFKSGPGEYGEGDVFIGVRVPALRQAIKPFAQLPPGEVQLLLDSPVHEHRLAAVLILAGQFQRASKPRTFDAGERTRLSDFYLAAVRAGRVNNWDLVDSSAPTLLGDFLFDRDRGVLFELAASDILWERRAGMIATQGLIGRGDASTTLELASVLLPDRADLMQKAVGWMLREVGKRVDRALLLQFLDAHAAEMGRTALSYATEHLAPELRAEYRARK
ncbi:DNA alkylation repair protein [Leifsonia sp. YAF41]|uniref:DNA alkylation repair protein n=1 Tax=Leifsonia sp. YAF41 TaxID=3233086 RepID=UPI003F99A9D4